MNWPLCRDQESFFHRGDAEFNACLVKLILICKSGLSRE